jgi:hypothetical protein
VRRWDGWFEVWAWFEFLRLLRIEKLDCYAERDISALVGDQLQAGDVFVVAGVVRDEWNSVA